MKKHRIIWFIYFIAVFVAFDITRYFVGHNLLRYWHIGIIDFIFLCFGWIGARLEIKYPLKKVKK